jgi:glyoxylase-like metal-dependent hydrolase (beta-lactamase superfamily II)
MLTTGIGGYPRRCGAIDDARAAATEEETTQMPAPMLKVGSITIVPLSDGTSTAVAAEIFPNVPADQWESVREFLGPGGTFTVNYGSFLIREGDTWTLVDTGFGNRPGTAGGGLLGELDKAKVRPDEITRVVITHLHGDHIGGNTFDRDGKPDLVFKNARHVVQRRDWDFFVQPDMMATRPVLGLCATPLEAAGALDLIDGDESISQGISAVLTPGHTPGHQSILITSGEEKAIIVGDASHTPLQLIHPDWSPPYDVDPIASAQTRVALFDRIEQQGLKVAAGHYPYPSIGGIVRVEGKRTWQPMR